MSLLGEFLGYDGFGNDLIGVNESCSMNCPVCGFSAMIHNAKMERECMGRIFGNTNSPAPSPANAPERE